MSSSFGPWISLALFHFLGNQWHAHDCRLVLASGLLLMAAPLALMCFFDDDQTLEAQQLRAQQAAGQQGGQQREGGQQAGGGQLEDGPAALPAGTAGEQAGCHDMGGNAAVQTGSAAAAEAAEAGAAGSQPLAADGQAACHTSGACNGSNAALASAPAARMAAAPLATTPGLGAARPSASNLLSLSELAGPTKVQRGEQEAAGCCAWLPPGLAVTLLISVSDLFGALASGGWGLGYCQSAGLGCARPGILSEQQHAGDAARI